MLAGSQKVRKYVALDQEYIKQNDLTEAKQLADVVWEKINNFITYLNKTVKPIKLIKRIKPIEQNNYGEYT